MFLQASCTSDDALPATAIPTSSEPESTLLEGIEIVETIPPTQPGDAPEPLHSAGPRSGGILAAPAFSCGIPDPAIDGAAEQAWIDDPLIVTEIHAGIFALSDDPNSPVQLELAESYDVREQGLLYRFVLRQDLKFSDGSPLTASDFKWSWERALRISLPGGRARDVFGSIQGAKAIVDGMSDDLIGVTVVDERTLEIRLTKARAEFTSLLADPAASVLKKDNVESWPVTWENPGGSVPATGFDETNLPIGAGPFKLANYRTVFEPGKDICTLLRNPHYWGRPAYLDSVWIRSDVVNSESDEHHDEWLSIDPIAFASEATDYESTPCIHGESPVDGADQMAIDGSSSYSAERAPTISFIVLNAAAPPFDDLHFRRAVIASADVDSIRWLPVSARRLISNDLTTLELLDEPETFDLEVASHELGKSRYHGHAASWDIGYLGPDTFGFAYDLEELFDTWDETLNMKVAEDFAGHSLIDNFDGKFNADYHFRMYHVIPTFPDPSTVLRGIVAPFGEIGKAPEFAEYEEMLEDAGTELDAVARHQKYLEIEAYLAEQALVIPVEIYPGSLCYRTHPWVNDLNPNKFLGSMFHNVWLDPNAPHREPPSP